MTKQQKILLLTLGGVAVAGGVGWYVYSSSGKGKRSIGISQQRAKEVILEQTKVGPRQIFASREAMRPEMRDVLAAATQRGIEIQRGA
jgi:hypothetical protein